MAAIGKGDWLLCIETSDSCDGAPGVVRGRVYCVDRIEVRSTGPCTACGDRTPGFQLVGISEGGGAWCHCIFKPLGGNAKTLKAPPITAPVRVGEDA